MQIGEVNQLKKEERSREQSKKADKFWQAFLLTENGKVKSTLLLNSFCLSFAFLAVYAVAFAVLVDAVHPLVKHLPVALINLVEAALPAVAGSAVCNLLWLVCKEKRLLPAAYLWLALLAAACLVTMLILLRGEAQARMYFLQFFLLFVPAPILLGGGLSFFLYLRHRKRRTADVQSLERAVKL